MCCASILYVRRLYWDEVEDSTTCYEAQQIGTFTLKDPSKCDKPNWKIDTQNSRGQLLLLGAEKCCKSKDVDQTICQFDKCLTGMVKCLGKHYDFVRKAKDITDPKGMQANDEGQYEGDCSLAILNRVEGELCCTPGMKELPACVKREVGDYTLCKDSWNTFYEPTFFQKAVAVEKAFKTGGYCTGFDTTTVRTTTPIPTSSTTTPIPRALPCENPSNYISENTIDGFQKCDSAISFLLPSTVAECITKPGEVMNPGNMIKAAMMKHVFIKCCKPGSKPNTRCGFHANTVTPCASKAEGEFLPAAM